METSEDHGANDTLAPRSRATSAVLSVEPVSTTTTSAASPSTLSRQRGRTPTSSRVITHTVTRAGRAASARICVLAIEAARVQVRSRRTRSEAFRPTTRASSGFSNTRRITRPRSVLSTSAHHPGSTVASPPTFASGRRTSSAETRYATESSQKSRHAPCRGTITAKPQAIASAIGRPKPSPRYGWTRL